MSKIRARIEITVVEGKEAELENLMAEFVATVSAGDPGTEGFAFYRSQKEGTYIALEQYESSEAAIAHIANVQHMFGTLGELLAASGPLEMHGEPSDELLELYAGFRPVVLNTVCGF